MQVTLFRIIPINNYCIYSGIYTSPEFVETRCTDKPGYGPCAASSHTVCNNGEKIIVLNGEAMRVSCEEGQLYDITYINLDWQSMSHSL